MTDWKHELEQALAALSGNDPEQGRFLAANRDLIARALHGEDASRGAPAETVGGRVVVNVSSAHIPDFTAANARYLNAYDLERMRARAGEAAPSASAEPAVSAKRSIVDAALQAVTGLEPKDIYFAAAEMGGCGIGFYGDVCLVLKDDVAKDTTWILDRNSYDLIRAPLADAIRARAAAARISEDDARAHAASDMSGRLDADLPAIAAIKVLEGRRPAARLLTTGMVTDGVLDDEDYIEVLRPQSFETANLLEARLTVADAAAEQRIRTRSLTGPAPTGPEEIWHDRRRAAEVRLHVVNVPVRVVTSGGRVKS